MPLPWPTPVHKKEDIQPQEQEKTIQHLILLNDVPFIDQEAVKAWAKHNYYYTNILCK